MSKVHPLIIGIGSANPVKIEGVRQAVTEALAKLSPERQPEFRFLAVETGASLQPMSEEETEIGARNRAQNVLKSDPEIDIAIGPEGGVTERPDGLYSTVWVCVSGRGGESLVLNGWRFVLPEELAAGIRAGGEMGHVMDRMMGRTNLKHAEGMIGILSGGVVTRQEAYAVLVKLAFSLYWQRFG